MLKIFFTLLRSLLYTVKRPGAFLFIVAFVMCAAAFPSPAHANEILNAIGGFLGGAVDNIGGAVGGAVEATVLKPIATALFYFAISIGGMFVGIGGLALDLSIQMLVVEMGNFFGDAGLGGGVIELWKIVRDMFNIVFIFSFIYLGIRTILNSDSASTQRALGYLLVAALLINFSLYITQAIVDFSNIAATQIYNQIVYGGSGAEGVSGGGLFGTQGANTANMQFAPWSIAGSFLSATNITTFFGGSGTILAADFTSVKILVYAVFMMIFFIITGFVFLIAAIRIIARFIALIIYMVFSPAMFLGWILPKFAAQSSKWWGGFLKNAFFAPAFLFLVYMSLLLMGRLRTQLMGETGDFMAILKGGTMQVSEFEIILFFLMMIGLMYASVKVGDLMSVAGAKSSVKFVDGLRNNMQGMLYRNTVGKGLDRFGVGAMDRLDRAAEGGNKAARLTRTVLGGESTRKALEKASNYGAGGTGKSDAEKMDKERASRASRSAAVDKIGDAIKSGSAIRNIYGPKTPAQEAAIRNMERTLRDASNPQLLEIADSKEGQKMLIGIAGSLSPGQVKALVESDKVTDKFREDFYKERSKQIETRVGTDFGGANKSDLNVLGPDTLAKPEVAINLSEKQIDALDFTDIDKGNIKQIRKDSLRKVVEDGATIGTIDTASLLKKKPEFIADLPKEVFAVDSFAKELPIPALEEIYRKHDKGTQAGIRTSLDSIAGPKGAAGRPGDIYDFLNNDRIGKNFGK